MRIYIIYDQRAYTLDPDQCAIMCTALSLEEAQQDRDDMFPGCPIYSYYCDETVKIEGKDGMLTDRRFEE